MTQFLQALFDGLSQGGVYAVLAVGVAVVSAVMSFPNFATERKRSPPRTRSF